jgi:type VI secretion system protein ImpL
MKKFFTSWYFLTIALFVVLILLTVVGLPLFVEWMQPWWVRLSFGLGFASLWLLWLLLRLRKIKKAEEALAKELAGPDPSGDEAQTVAARMNEALAELRKASGKKRNYLYSLPWYVIIGPPGAGKTTALINSGLRFPFTDEALGGTGGTRNLDFLFAEEAVLVDTAGRYTTQDSDREVDAAGWKRLLESLAKHRPFEPINGVFVAIPADDLQTGDVKVIDDHAAIIRRRLREIREVLETELPVYLLITKADKLSGLTEFFGDLDVEGRRAVVGHTFDWKHKKLKSQDVTSGFDHFANDLAARTAKRLEEEKDIRRRGLILGFPGQLHAMRAALHRLIEGAFLKEDRPSGQLRGFYLTSGTQDGSAIDRILEGVSRAYDRNDPARREGGKAYFLNRLLTEVAFGEAGLPVTDPGVVRRRQTRLTAMVAGITVLALLAIGLWTVSFLGNRDFQDKTLSAAVDIEQDITTLRADLAKVGAADTPLEELVPLLDKLRNLPEGYAAQQRGGPSIFMRFGLFQSGLARRNEETYRIALRRILLPRVLLRLEDKMRQEMDNAVLLYEPLKTYLMLGGAAPEGKFSGKTVRDYVSRDWANEVYSSAEQVELRRKLGRHLKALVEDPDINQAWGKKRGPLDGNLVASARATVGAMDLAERAFVIMRSQAADPSKDWYMGYAIQAGDARAFANPDEVMSQQVPFFFTKEGFAWFSKRKPLIGQTLKSELWVLGENAQAASIQREMANLDIGLSGAYADEYIKQWERVIESLKAADYFNNKEAFSAFTKGVSPLRLVLEAVRYHTSFGKGGAEGRAARMVQNRIQQNRIGRVGSKLAGAGTDEARGLTADELITKEFEEINRWVGTNKNPGEIDAFIKNIKQTFSEFEAAKRTDDSAAALAKATADLETAALGVPSMVSTFAKDVASGGSRTGDKAAKGQISSYYAENVAPACDKAIAGNYPFDPGSDTDAGDGDVRQTFGGGGIIDTFVKTRLGSYLDQGGEYWRWKSENPVAAKLNPAAPGNLQKAETLKSVIDNGLQMTFTLTDLGDDASKVKVVSGGSTTTFDLGSNRSSPMRWTLGGGAVPTSEIEILGASDPEASDQVDQVLWFEKKTGGWSLFKVIERAQTENLSENRIAAVFNSGPGRARFEISFPPDQNPFSGGGLWSVKCPATL